MGNLELPNKSPMNPSHPFLKAHMPCVHRPVMR